VCQSEEGLPQLRKGMSPTNGQSPINPSPLLTYALLQAHSFRLRRNLPWTTLIFRPLSKSPSLQRRMLSNGESRWVFGWVTAWGHPVLAAFDSFIVLEGATSFLPQLSWPTVPIGPHGASRSPRPLNSSF
jgi:hypothetical protein